MTVVKKRLLAGETCFGTWISSGSPFAIDVLRNFPLDWMVFDMEHSPVTTETVYHMLQVIQGAEMIPLVRVGEVDQAIIKNVLDSGSKGIVAPLVNTREDAERLVQFCSYPPTGVRGVAATRASRYGFDSAKYLRTANDENLIVAQIETITALKNIEEILEVKGIDVAFVGPSDLTMQLGLVDDRSNPRVGEAMEQVVKACKKHGKVAGVMAASGDDAKKAVERGFGFVSLASDMRFLMHGAREFLKSVGRG
jgi:2-keto-3-deoxy-L-rhamnonate aldolase RhmA